MKNAKQDRARGDLLSALIGRPWLVSAGLVAALVAVACVFSPRYETLDDAITNLIAAGRVFADAPDEHLPFGNVLIGLVLRSAYRAAPDYPWYGGYLLTVGAVSLVVVCQALLRANPTRKQFLLVVVFLLAVGLPCLVQLQFTRVAFLAALAGLLTLVVVAAGRLPTWQAGLAAALLLLACLVRRESCLLAGVVLGPAVAVALWQCRRTRCVYLVGLTLAGTVLGGLLLGEYNRWYYAQGPWADFHEYQALLARFTDYLPVEYNERTRPLLDRVGWAQVDLDMLYQFNVADPERYSAARLREVLAGVGTEERIMAWRSWGTLADTVVLDVTALPLLAAVAAGLVLAGGGWRGRVVPLLCLLAALVVCLVLYRYFHLPARVYFPALAAVLGAVIVSAVGELSPADWRVRSPAGAGRVVTVVAAALFVLIGLIDLGNLGSAARARSAQARKMLARLAPRKNQLFVLWADAFPYQDVVLPLQRLALPRQFKAVGLIWVTHTPLTARRLEEFGITDLYRALYERPDVLLFSNPLGNRILGAYLARHYGIRLGGRAYFTDPALGPIRIYALHELSGKEAPRPRKGLDR